MYFLDESTFSDMITKSLVESERSYQSQLDCIVKVLIASLVYLF